VVRAIAINAAKEFRPTSYAEVRDHLWTHSGHRLPQSEMVQPLSVNRQVPE